MWKYLYYLVYLKTKDPTEYTGLESFVASLIEEEDVGFYPVNKSMCLDADDEEEDPFQVETLEKIDQHFKEMSNVRKQLTAMRSENTSIQYATVDFNKRVLARLDNLAEQRGSIRQAARVGIEGQNDPTDKQQ